MFNFRLGMFILTIVNKLYSIYTYSVRNNYIRCMNTYVGVILYVLQGSGKKMKNLKKSRKLLKAVSVPVALFICAILVGAVLLNIYSAYIGTQEMDIEVEGRTCSILVDGEGLDGDSTFTIAADVFSDNKLVFGETATFSHTVELLAGHTTSMVKVAFDTSAVEFTDPLDTFYGYYIDILDASDISIKDGALFVAAEAGPSVFKIEHELDPMFAYTEEILPFSIDVLISDYVELFAPDYVHPNPVVSTSIDIDVVSMCTADPDADLELTAVGGGDGDVTPVIGPTGLFHIGYTWPYQKEYIFTFEVTDHTSGLVDSGTVTINEGF